MRRSSVVAPLLLIGIGGLFLFRNLYPDLPLLDYLARYWPVLLIIWGGLRLAEILMWSSTNRPLPKRGVSGGEWILIIMLCMFGGALYVAKGGWNDWWGGRFRFSGIEMFGESFEYSLAGEKAASKTPRIIIDSFRGNARIVWRTPPIRPISISGSPKTASSEARMMRQGSSERWTPSVPFTSVTKGPSTSTWGSNSWSAPWMWRTARCESRRWIRITTPRSRPRSRPKF
jgi:hypothetical protein